MILTFDTADLLHRLHFWNTERFVTMVPLILSRHTSDFSITKFTDNMENATNTKTFRAGLYDNTPEGEVFVGYVLATINTRDVNLNAGSRYFLKDMLEVDDLPTFNILDSDQPLQTEPATVHVDGHEGFDETIDLPDFDNLDEALDEFDSIAEKVEAAEKKITAKENKGIKKLSERKYQKLKQRVKMNIKISKKERQHYEEQKALRELFSIVSA